MISDMEPVKSESRVTSEVKKEKMSRAQRPFLYGQQRDLRTSLLVTNRETCRERVPTPCPRLHPSHWDSTIMEEYEGRAAGE